MKLPVVRRASETSTTFVVTEIETIWLGGGGGRMLISPLKK